MKLVELSPRLKTLTKYVAPFQYVVDVGTDHCFVPIYLKQHGLIKQAIASDINIGPIEEAKRNIKRYGYVEDIDARCGNGLQTLTLNDQVDVIIIAGMGGKLITDILESNYDILQNNKRLILQANVACDVIRSWLSHHPYEIIEEEVIIDNDIIYEIIVADRTNKPISYTHDEMMFGPLLMKQRDPLFIQKWEETLQFKQSILKKIPLDHENRDIVLADIEGIKQVLK